MKTVFVLESQLERDSIDALGVDTSGVNFVVLPHKDVLSLDISLDSEYVFTYQVDIKSLRKHWSHLLETPVPPIRVGCVRWPVVKISFGLLATSVSSLCAELAKYQPADKQKFFDQIFRRGSSFGVFDTRIPVRSQDAAKFVEIIAAIMRTWSHLFVRSGKICVLDSNSNATPLDEPSLTSLLSKYIRFVKDDGVDTLPPARLVRAIQPHVLVGVNEIISVAHHPVISYRGDILTGRAYSRDYRIYTTYDRSLNIEHMDRDAASRFLAEEMREFLVDFPMKSDADYSSWLAFVLSHFFVFETPICYPMTIIEANTAGAGKTLLVKLASIICHGKIVPPLPLSSQDEIRKCLLAFIGQCKETLWFDNIVGRFGCPTLDAILTSPCWSDRVLGSSQIVSSDLRIIPVATANNAVIGHDLVRRSVRCRLVSDCETPETRKDFRYPDIIGLFMAKRDYFVSKMVSVLYSYIRALENGTAQCGSVLGSFEIWSKYISGCIEWCGLPSPIATQAELRAEADSARSALSELLVLWGVLLDKDGKGLTPGEIDLAVRLAPSDPGWQSLTTALEELCEGSITPSKISAVLRKYKDKIVGGRRLLRKEVSGRILWFVENVRK